MGRKCTIDCVCGLHRPYTRTPEHRRKMSEACKARSADPVYIQRQRDSQTGKSHTYDPVRKARQDQLQSERMLFQYANGTRWAQKILESGQQSPNRLEKLMLKYLAPLGWEFVGNGQVWIVGKNPDFIHRERHELLEVFGDYWHCENDVRERISHFAAYGWPCKVIWESEIKTNLDVVLYTLK